MYRLGDTCGGRQPSAKSPRRRRRRPPRNKLSLQHCLAAAAASRYSAAESRRGSVCTVCSCHKGAGATWRRREQLLRLYKSLTGDVVAASLSTSSIVLSSNTPVLCSQANCMNLVACDVCGCACEVR